MTKHPFRDSNGQIVIWQTPNLPLSGWIICRLITYFHHSQGLSLLGTAFLFTWAYLELVSGVTIARRVMGAIVIFGIVWGMF